MNEFKVGDRVEAVKNFRNICKGMEGTIIGIMPGCRDDIAVEFDTLTTGHDCSLYLHSDLCKPRHGSWVYPSEIKKINSKQTIIIYTQGNKTIAILKEGKKEVKRAVAKCNPTDTFDLEYGTKLALNRLFGTVDKFIKGKQLENDLLALIAKYKG